MQYKTGIGYDIHRFIKGRKLFLGGVEIPYYLGLEGHSDADVLTHAICDALLGALGRGDIGEHFPNTDPEYRNISSMVLLETVYHMVQNDGYMVNNLDVVIQAEEPSLKEYKSKIKFNLAYKLAVDETAINIKATTQEGLGDIGEKKGIAAFVTVLLKRKGEDK
jgi:2-C-methyl-D-erythritol 2,4-cyclodiphosphate synthase